jgi:large subunit ribosomal protein L7e
LRFFEEIKKENHLVHAKNTEIFYVKKTKKERWAQWKVEKLIDIHKEKAHNYSILTYVKYQIRRYGWQTIFAKWLHTKKDSNKHEQERQNFIKDHSFRENKTTEINVPPRAKQAFVLRVRGQSRIGPRALRILKILRLHKLLINNGIFVSFNKASVTMLNLIEPFIAYGYLNLKTIRNLILKRGHCKINGGRIALRSGFTNVNPKMAYSIVDEISDKGPNFREVSNCLLPFQLASRLGGVKNKRNHYVEGGSAGNQEEKMDKMVRAMI